MLLNCALPNTERAFILKRKNHKTLCESLVYLKDETSSLLDESEQIRFQSLIDDLQNNPDILFPFTLLNEALVESAQADNADGFKKLLSSFAFQRANTKKPLSVFPFGDDCFSPEQWQQCEELLISELSGKPYIKEPSNASFERTSTLIQEALEEIKRVAPDYFSEIEALVSNVVVVTSDYFIAGSSFAIFGLVAIADNHDFNMTVEYLIHEAAHQYLYNLSTFDALCSGEGLHTSPLRKEPRPIEGIYHAAFVLARIIDFYNNALVTETILPKDFMEKQIDHYRLRYKDAYDLLMEKATLTDLGRELLASSRELTL
tara:strand:- start:34 stop:984 length:951 start_codon:yes stop_codon:yes gene_type:complete